MRVQPGAGGSDQAGLLAGIHRLLGGSEGRGPARLYLDEGNEPSSPHYEVNLHTSHPDVAFDDAIPSSCEEACGTQLPFRAEGAAVVTGLHLLGSTGPGDERE